MRKRRTILFVCTGNICRSPMAEYMFKARLGRRSGWTVESAGTVVTPGRPASAAAIEALAECGIDASGHRSRPLTRGLVDAADTIVVMTWAQKVELMELFPDVAGKVHLLKSFDQAEYQQDVEDPIGLPVEGYKRVRDSIARAFPDLLLFLHQNWGLREPPPEGVKAP